MASDMRPLPTAAELDRLASAWRDNPRSTGFVPLAEAYLALGRPREAIEALVRGLEAHPDNIPARLVLGRAHALLHEWKEAQVELLRVVKTDRQSRDGFRLLGEVLMRRQDYERALPVLQHAANLDPADGKVLSMLRRAREGRPLEPPAPLPTPVAPAGGPPPGPGARRAAAFDEPTRVADEHPSLDDPNTNGGLDAPTSILDDGRRPGAAARPPARASAPPAPPAPPRPPPRPSAPPPPMAALTEDPAAIGRMPLKPQGPARIAEEKASRRVEDARAAEPPPEKRRGHVPPAEDPFRPVTERRPEPVALGAASGAADPGAPPRPPPAARPGERPRGVQATPNKRSDAGAVEMRRGAAVGEDYLNQLLVGGLLAVPNVEARDHGPSTDERRRWRRKTLGAFVVLWALLIAVVGGGGTYYYVTKKRAEAEVQKRLARARELIAVGRQVDLKKADEELQAALKTKGGDAVVLATMAEGRALALLWYGAGELADVDAAVAAAGKLRTAADSAPGKREYVVARVARNLAVLAKVSDANQAIGEAQTSLAGALAQAPGDGALLYLDGALKLALGDRVAARASLEKADTGGQGPPSARVAIGDLLLDEGDTAGAQAAYEAALGRAPGHPLALVGRALARADRSAEPEAAMQDINVGLAGVVGSRSEAWKHVALAAVWALLEDYEKSQTELDAAQASGLDEPRFLARIALARLDRGKVADAGLLRQKIRYFGTAPGRDPMALLLDAELFMATGMPDDALAAVGDNPTLRAHLVKGRALLDLGKAKAGLAEFDLALKIAPDDQRTKAYAELARVLVALLPGGERGKGDAAFEALQKLARSSVSGQVRYVFAEAHLARGNSEDARRNFEASLEGDNPLAYRARTRLAEIYLIAGRDDDAEKMLREALTQSPVYAPARAGLGRLLLKRGKTAEAVQELEPAIAAGRATAADEIAYAGALLSLGKKEEAKAPLRRAREKGASAEVLAPLAGQIDAAFAAELGVADGGGGGSGGGGTAPPKRRRR
jgi:tetratricopeptide (TPR) repeat protein